MPSRCRAYCWVSSHFGSSCLYRTVQHLCSQDCVTTLMLGGIFRDGAACPPVSHSVLFELAEKCQTIMPHKGRRDLSPTSPSILLNYGPRPVARPPAAANGPRQLAPMPARPRRQRALSSRRKGSSAQRKPQTAFLSCRREGSSAQRKPQIVTR